MPNIVQATIEPIRADKLRLEKLTIPVPAPPGVHCPQILSHDPLVVAPETIEHARSCAKTLIERMANLPHTAEAGDLLAMAYTILHLTKETP
jgi:hypothetical protein